MKKRVFAFFVLLLFIVSNASVFLAENVSINLDESIATLSAASATTIVSSAPETEVNGAPMPDVTAPPPPLLDTATDQPVPDVTPQNYEVIFCEGTTAEVLRTFYVEEGGSISFSSIPSIERQDFLGWLFADPATGTKLLYSAHGISSLTITANIQFYAVYQEENLPAEETSTPLPSQPTIEETQAPSTSEPSANPSDERQTDKPDNEPAPNEDSAIATPSEVPEGFLAPLDHQGTQPLAVSIFTIRYFAQDESGTPYELTDFTQYVQSGQATVSPGSPPAVPEGKSAFDYWALEGNEQAFDFSSPVLQDINLTAVYRSDWLVQFFDASLDQGGTGKVLASQKIADGNKASADLSPQISIIPGKSLGGWVQEGQSTPFDFENKTITADVNLYPLLIDRLSVFFITDGSPVDLQLVVANTCASEPAPPSRVGYTFSHWSLTQNGTAFDFSLPIEQDTVLYAVWTPEMVDYTVVYWVEKANLTDGSGNPKDPQVKNPGDFDYVKSVTGNQALAGSTITEADLGTLDSVEYAQYLGMFAPEIQGNGKTVVNVYFSLIKYTVSFDVVDKRFVGYYNPYQATMTYKGQTYTKIYDGSSIITDERYSFQAKMGQDISDVWPSYIFASFEGGVREIGDTEYTSYTFTGWFSSKNVLHSSKRFRLVPDLVVDSTPANNYTTTLTGVWNKKVYTYDLEYWLQALPDEEASAVEKGFEDKSYLFFKNEEFSQENFYTTAGTVNPKLLKGTENIGVETDLNEEGTIIRYRYYYLRNIHTITFETFGGTAIPKVEKVLYEAPVQLYKPQDPVREGYRFAGWYMDAECKEPLDWQITMPDENLIAFAKWEQSDHLVYFYEEQNAYLVQTQGVSNNGSPLRPNLYQEGQEYFSAEPGKEDVWLGVFRGWKWLLPGSNRLVSFNFDTNITKDTHIYADWDRDGLIVTYQKGSNINNPLMPEDRNEYDFGSTQARAPLYSDYDPLLVKYTDDASTYYFSHWKDQINRVYYPGAIIPVDRNLILTAQYALENQLVKITYHSNYSGSSDTYEDLLSANSTVTLRGDGTFIRNGFDLLGWSTTPSDTVEYPLSGSFLTGQNGQNVDLYAIWSIQTCAVQFKTANPAMGLLEKDNVSQNEFTFENLQAGDSLLALAPIPTPMEGYSFSHWTGPHVVDGVLPDTVTTTAIYTAHFKPYPSLAITASPYIGMYDALHHGIALQGADAYGDKIIIEYSPDGQTGWQAMPITQKDVTVGLNVPAYGANGGLPVYIRIRNNDVTNAANPYAPLELQSYIQISKAPLTIVTGADPVKATTGDKVILNYKVSGFVANENWASVFSSLNPNLTSDYTQKNSGTFTAKITNLAELEVAAKNYYIILQQGEFVIVPVPVDPSPTPVSTKAPQSTDTVPSTGDPLMPLVWVTLATGALAALLWLTVLKKTKETNR